MPGKSKKPVEAETDKDKVKQIIENSRVLLDFEYENRARRHLWNLHGIGDTEIERRFKITIAVCEHLLSEKNKRTTRAARTWQKLSRMPVKQAIEEWVLSSSTATSFELFELSDLKCYSAEQIVVDFREEFEPRFFAAAFKRLSVE